MKKTIKVILLLMLCFVTITATVHPVEAATTKKVTSTKKKTTKKKTVKKSTKKSSAKKNTSTKIKVLVVAKSGPSTNRLIQWLKSAGFEVTRTIRGAKVKPNNFDALVIPGGQDVTPELYGQKKTSLCGKTELWYDRLQINAIKKFVKAGKPVFGVCRGMQLINVALGGTMKQDIGWRHRGYEKLKTVSGSRMSKIYGSTAYLNHANHQCVDKLASGIRATAYHVDSEGLTNGTTIDNKFVEAIEHVSKPIFGVQFHPETSGTAGKKVLYEWRAMILANKNK